MITRTTFLLLMLCSAVCSGAEHVVVVTDLTAKPQKSITSAGNDADKIIQGFESLSWDGTAGARCHIPAYRIEEKSENKLLLDATVCFACNNVRFLIPQEKGLKGFVIGGDSAKLLKKILTDIFAKKT